MDKNTFTVVDENGTEKEYTILLSFDSEDTGKSYVVYTDKSRREDGSTVVFASIMNKETGCLEAIETEREWRLIERMLNTIQEEFKAGRFDQECIIEKISRIPY